jgi:hypothetical protein
MNTIRLLIGSFALLLLSGCVVVNGESSWHDSDWKKEQRKNREAIAELQIGMERSQVVSRLGVPDYSEAFSRDGDEFRVLFFRTRHRHSDGETSRDETTPLVFRNDLLIGWGDDVLASIR